MHLYPAIVWVFVGGPCDPMTDMMRPFIVGQERFGTFSLPIGRIYVAWLAVVVTRYPLCRW